GPTTKGKQPERPLNPMVGEAPHLTQMPTFADLTFEDKTTYLQEMFPSIDQHTINHSLMKCGENVDRSMDLLLNLAFFHDQGSDDVEGRVSIPKGIDGFEGKSNFVRGRRKGKNKRRKTHEPPGYSESAPPSSPIVENKWDNGK